ncbi:UNVERIFIED_CONTAM: hypothetical protein NY603_17950, partial [Bacteroidetes bacterium 56_B9]
KMPTLTGTDNFVVWKRAITNYLRQKDALRVLEGREVEPYRDQQAATPDDAYAGYEPPAGPSALIPGDAGTSTTNANLTIAQFAKWKEWERKESKARSALLMSVSSGIAADVENLWSSADIYKQICDEHRI